MPTPIVLVEAGRPMTCRACGGDGVSADVHPRIAAAMRRRFVLRPTTGPLVNTLHVQVSHETGIRNNVMQRPLAAVTEIVLQRLEAGSHKMSGDLPDLEYACERCKGTGEDPLTLSARTEAPGSLRPDAAADGRASA